MTRRYLARACAVVACLAGCWAIVVMWTGGIVVHFGDLRITSRAPRNVSLGALLLFFVAWVLGAPGQRTTSVAADCRWLLDVVARRVPRIRLPAPVIAGVAAIGVVIVGLTEGAFIVGGSDSYGYVSQAHLWSIGQYRQEPVLFRPLAPEVNIDALAPLGYRPTIDGVTIAPTYSPGLPMVMAVFERLAGPASVFWVVPIFAGVLVWLTYLLGTRLHGPLVGVLAAMLVATSPPVLIQVTAAPLSDVFAAAWCTLAFLLIGVDRRTSALGAGAAAGVAILTRPNLVPLFAVAVGYMIARLMMARRSVREIVQHLVLFALCAGAACFTIAIINRTTWGSAVQSGYGSLGDLFDLSNIWTNLLLYPRAAATLIPAACLAPCAWFARRSGQRVTFIALGAWALAVVLLYMAFPAYDSEWNLRFLLPALPPLFVLATIAALWLAGSRVERHPVACVIVVAIVCGYGVHMARKNGAFDMEHIRRYAAIGKYIERELPPQAVLFALYHSGSATYYSGRPTLRWDLLAPSRLDRLVDVLQQRGYVPYLLIDNDERALFLARYRGHSGLGTLDWKPVVSMYTPPVQLYAIPR